MWFEVKKEKNIWNEKMKWEEAVCVLLYSVYMYKQCLSDSYDTNMS
jgi:hypothetical protein